jgi:hypothetical protein
MSVLIPAYEGGEMRMRGKEAMENEENHISALYQIIQKQKNPPGGYS